MKPQNQALLDRLKLDPITPLEALTELGIYRLGARIHELRQSGHKIETRIAKVKNRQGNVCHVAEYRLGGSP
jgi:hypothetical protein